MDEVQKQAVAVIDETLRLLERVGWCKNTSKSSDGRMCLSFAQFKTARQLGTPLSTSIGAYTDVGVMLERAFCVIHPDALVIPDYNDRDDTTYQDVVNTLKLMREEVLNPQDEVLL